MQPLGQHALVIGASMGGLLAARVLSDYYEQVTICDRDAVIGVNQPRRGVPQGQHTHALLAKGQEILEQLFPGLTQALVDQGALVGDLGTAGRWFYQGGYYPQVESGLTGIFVSRPLLEAQVSSWLLNRSNVQIMEQCIVLDWLTNQAGNRVTGIRCQQRTLGDTEISLPADLVVDASGRSSRTPAWLDALGYPKPELETVAVDICYTTRLYRRNPQHLRGEQFMMVTATPENQRVGAIMAQEGDRWVVSLAGYAGNHPDVDNQEFLTFAKHLAVPDIYEVICQAEPLSQPVAFKSPASQRRHYEKLTRFPEGVLVIGDAICSFTPLYGQGMSVIALEAQALQQCLQQGTERLAQRFFQTISTPVNIAWELAKIGDLRIPAVPGQRSLRVRLLNWYINKLHRAAHGDRVIALAFYRVTNMMAVPSILLQPSIVMRIVAGSLRSPLLSLVNTLWPFVPKVRHS